jgi:hypothetical protein
MSTVKPILPGPQASSVEWALFYSRWGAVKPAYDKKDTGIRATRDPDEIRRVFGAFPGAGVTLKTSGFTVTAIDVDDSEILGLHGIKSLQRIAERIGYPATLTPFGYSPTPTCVTVRGMHFYYLGPGCFVPSGILARNVEIKGDGAAIRMPPGMGRCWDPNLPPTLPLAPHPNWGWIGGKPGDQMAMPSGWGNLPPEAALAGRDVTPFGQMIAGRIIRGILKKAHSTAECCGRVRSLGRLVVAGKISEAYALALIEGLVPLLGPFEESGFHHDRLLPAMRKSFMKACHGR